MNVLVVGAGIGGITAALTLSRAGQRVTLAEKAERFAPVGAGIVMAPNAAKALVSLGVDLSSRGFPLPSLDVVRRTSLPPISFAVPTKLITNSVSGWS